MEISEQIGNITLDYKHYPGEDLYCDGTVEDELLTIARECSPVEFQTMIEEKKEWPVLYHLSALRENIVSWLPIDSSMRVLEIGSGCGAITGALAKKAGQVSCVDLSKKRSMINAYRHTEYDNITIHVGNFADIEPDLSNDYDYALLIGVLEYGKLYIGGKTPFEDFIRTIRKHVKKNGSIVIAIENKYGLKYWAGCREDHLGTFFSGLENYPEDRGVETFSKAGLEKIFKNCDENEQHFYYPYPDYKFMTTLFSDDRLPMVGELTNNLRNFDRDRIQLFDERKVFDGLIEENMFPFYSNSFLVVLGNRPKTDYIRYSNDRALAYQISTEIYHEATKKLVKKHALSNESIAHVKQIISFYKKLSRRYDSEELIVNPILSEDDTSVTFAFEEGELLSSMFDKCLACNDMDAFANLFEEYVHRISRNEEFPIADYDLVFSNIIVKGNSWKLIDYEWTCERQIETKELAFRALYCYLLEDEERNKFNYDLIIEKLGITPDEADGYREKEAAFQKEVTGKRMPMAAIRDLLDQPVMTPKSFEKKGKSDKINRIQIYEDKGSGFSEENSYFIKESYDQDGSIFLTIQIPADVKKVRIDPCMTSCALQLHSIILNGTEISMDARGRITMNAKAFAGENNGRIAAVFGNMDPGITVDIHDLVKSTGNTMQISLQTTMLPIGIARELDKELKRKIRL